MLKFPACWTAGALLLVVSPAIAQQNQAPPPVQESPVPAEPTNATSALPNDGKVRIYVSDSQSWEMTGGWGAANGSAAATRAVEPGPKLQKSLKPSISVARTIRLRTIRRANYAVILDHEGGKGALRRRNKVAVFNRDGDAIFSDSTRELGSSVKDACAAMAKDQGSSKR
jgi:hypothetical protein